MNPKNNLIVIAYYTDDHDYKQRAMDLKESVEALDMQIHIEEYNHPKKRIPQSLWPYIGWVLGCSLCPAFICNMRIRYPKKHLLYLDADAVMKSEPELFLQPVIKTDIAYAIIKDVTATGTLFFNGFSDIDRFLFDWRELQWLRCQELLDDPFHKGKKLAAWDQRTFAETLHKYHHLKKLILPGEYCKIAPHNGRDWHKTSNEIVIYQNQTSRTNKENKHVRYRDGNSEKKSITPLDPGWRHRNRTRRSKR